VVAAWSRSLTPTSADTVVEAARDSSVTPSAEWITTSGMTASHAAHAGPLSPLLTDSCFVVEPFNNISQSVSQRCTSANKYNYQRSLIDPRDKIEL